MYAELSLISLALGYQVFAGASKEKKDLKVVGRAIGILVILMSMAGVVCGVTRCIAEKKGECALTKMRCPLSAKPNCPLSGPSKS